jgi:hypothetical protein
MASLKALLDSGQLEPFIRHIRFPFFKNLKPGTHIEFSYPITALIGANGTNKSTVIRALYGCPGYQNLGELWFSTVVDPILETKGEGRNRFIYGYLNEGADGIVEVIKTRIMKESDPDYWEPSRPLRADGMAKMPPFEEGAKGRSKTRWETITKEVVFIDFRQALSAFDKSFYHYDDTRVQSWKSRKAWMRMRVSPLRRVIDGDASAANYHRKNRVLEDRTLGKASLDAVNIILGKNSKGIRLIKHSFFSVTGTTCILQSSDLIYTEAFAGSGEFAAVMLVDKIKSAGPRSLILLDEPEVSLHPGAQEQLLNFLSDEVTKRKHQIVLATHSPSMIRGLPPAAIKVFIPDAQTGKIALPSQASSPEIAFINIGEPLPGKKTIIVEDALAAEVVWRAARLGDGSLMSIIDVKYFPGGSETLWAHFVPTYAAENRQDVLVLFDGDKRPGAPFCDTKTVPESENSLLGKMIIEKTGVDVRLNPDGSHGVAKETQKFDMQRRFINWARLHTDYLPGNSNPEDFLWRIMSKDNSVLAISDASAKERFASLAHVERGLLPGEKVDSKMILETQSRRIARLGLDNEEMMQIRAKLFDFITNGNDGRA